MKVTALLIVLCMGGYTALAQGPRGHGGGGPGFGPMAGMEHGKVVTGAPFTATLQETFTQKLADGNTIAHTTTSQFARDSEGRTWLQTTSNRLGPWTSTAGPKTLTFITDPVAGAAYTLDQSAMTASERKLPAARAASDSAAGPRSRPGFDAESGVVRTPLGTQMSAPLPSALQGTQITRTIEANKIGNTQPIVTTMTRWYSPDLKMMVQQTSSDPRNGTRTFQITNIQLGEPASSLFQVPSGYTVTTGHARPAMRLAQ